MEGPLQERHIAQQLEIASGGRVALQPSTAPRQQDEGQVRPFPLPVEPLRQRSESTPGKRLLGHDDETGAVVELLDELLEVRADVGADVGFRQHGRRDGGVAAMRGKNERTLRERPVPHGPRSLR